MYMTTNQIDAENYKITSRKYIVFYFLFFVTIQNTYMMQDQYSGQENHYLS